METTDSLATTILKERPGLLERFELVRVLGEGAGSVVYLVRDLRGDRKEVALKVLTNLEAFDENTLVRFQRELRICQRIRHPNIVEAYDLINSNGVFAFSMEYVEGQDLSRCHGHERLSSSAVSSIMLQVLAGLEELHSFGLVHRDLKLENILLAKDGGVKISDLGLVKEESAKKLTRTGILLGTAPYMPPEYIRSGRCDKRSDIYATGIILYELLSGKRRLSGMDGNAAIKHLLSTKFALPREDILTFETRFAAVVEKACALKPERRFQSALEMSQALGNPDFYSVPSQKQADGKLRRLYEVWLAVWDFLKSL